jgi:hypothetical protein
MLLPTSAFAQSAESGAVLVDANTGSPLTGTLSSTQQFKITFATGSPVTKCTGPTSGSPSYSGFTYFVDNGIVSNPGTLTYSAAGPNQTSAFPLIETDGVTSLEAVPTDSTAGLQDTSLVTTPLEFEPAYGPFDPTDSNPSGQPMHPGTFNMGISCANTSAGGTADNYWNVQIVVAQNANDPGGNDFTWTIVPAAVTPEVPFAIVLPLSAAAVAGAGVWVLRRRRHPATTG